MSGICVQSLALKSVHYVEYPRSCFTQAETSSCTTLKCLALEPHFQREANFETKF